ncbi:MAG TPA: GlsB/YeaQ/YmgE family stress response membrane protein [Polyangiaceae bacterium]
MHLFVFLLFGLVVGALARFLVPGREPGGWIITLMLGVGGAIVGGYFGRVIGLYREGEPAGFIVSLLASISLVVVYKAFMTRRSRAT